MIYKKIQKINWKEYPKMMPLGERLEPSSKRFFPKVFFNIKDIILNGREMLCSLHLANRKVDDGSLDGNITVEELEHLKIDM
jgi:hypothetical protein